MKALPADVAAHEKVLSWAADQLDRAHLDRDRAIVEAHNAGVRMVDIAASVRLSRMQVHRIVKAARDEAGGVCSNPSVAPI